ncbi:MAG: hypothetical protein JXA90_01965 [Planctomycetes bacterium]|nr:hypothetical protein [Planctomycetota bacterium]
MSERTPASPVETFFPRLYLQRAIERQRLSHAYLFLGPHGGGKIAFAREFAQTLFCRAGRPCGRCASCRSIQHDNHPGVTFYRPPEGKLVIDIETIRQLCERSHFCREHVFLAVIEKAERMTVPAANALLKTLEEPGGEFIVVLTAATTGGLLPTVVSRCHRVYFPYVLIGAEAPPGGVEDERPEVDESLLREFSAADFHARHDIRAWLDRVVAQSGTGRRKVHDLLAWLIFRCRARLESAAAGDLDRWLDLVHELLECEQSLDANASPDLVLERLLFLLERWDALASL